MLLHLRNSRPVLIPYLTAARLTARPVKDAGPDLPAEFIHRLTVPDFSERLPFHIT